MRFFYRIFTPMKVCPIKIINTSSTGEKQLQIVPVKSSVEPKPSIVFESERPPTPIQEDHDSQNYKNKEHLFAHLQLQSKAKAIQAQEAMKRARENLSAKDERLGSKPEVKPEKRKRTPEPECIYEYEEPDKEEIKRFAEKRDREWALQKRMDEMESYHVSKKKKKNKHSKGDLHKKRKIHAEITSSAKDQESIKLKLKVTPHNGHKHKHKTFATIESPKTYELTNKEKLLQMRAVRHKTISGEKNEKQEEKTSEIGVNTVPLDSENKEEKEKSPKCDAKVVEVANKNGGGKDNEIGKLHIKLKSPSHESEVKPVQKIDNTAGGKILRGDFSIKTTQVVKYPTVQLERNEFAERQAQTTFLKTFQSHAEKSTRTSEKSTKIEDKQDKAQEKRAQSTQSLGYSSAQNVQTSLERKIASLQQQCTIEARNTPTPPGKQENKDKKQEKQVINNHYPPGFTVSKIENGVKRKNDDEDKQQDKRPSLEITLINPPNTTGVASLTKSNPTSVEVKTQIKRLSPATIPLDRIKSKINLNSGISIIPKLPERCDNIGALDLSKTNKTLEGEKKIINGFNGNGLTLLNKEAKGIQLNHKVGDRVLGTEKNAQLSNLQMLSKVASEHLNLNKFSPGVNNNNNNNNNNINKVRPHNPGVQPLKIPLPQGNNNQILNKTLCNQNKISKLNEISKAQYRLISPPIRNMRPNQNQNIRNIPNPSLLVRQQNQNRLNNMTSQPVQNGTDVKEQKKVEIPVAEKTCLEKLTEKSDVTVSSK